MADLEQEIGELLEGHRLQPHQRQALQQGELDADTVRRLQRMLANTQNAVLRLAREIVDGVRVQTTSCERSQPAVLPPLTWVHPLSQR